MMNTEHTMEQAFRLGWEEADGEVGTTYDDDPTSPRSEAYDCGRTVGRLPEPWKSTLAAAPAMLAALEWALCHVRFSGGPEGDAETFSANYNAAQSAIAQAKGEK